MLDARHTGSKTDNLSKANSLYSLEDGGGAWRINAARATLKVLSIRVQNMWCYDCMFFYLYVNWRKWPEYCQSVSK